MGMQDEIGTAINWNSPNVNADDSLRVAIQQMAKSEISALVVKRNEDVIGIVSDYDLLKGVVGKKDLDMTKVSELMTPCELITQEGTKNPCAQLDETESIENALHIIDVAGTHHLMVTGSDKGEVGMVSIRSLLGVAIS